MKTESIVLLCAFAALPGCVGVSYAGGAATQRVHTTQSASGITTVRVVNVSGPIVITASDTAQVVIDAVMSGVNSNALARTHVQVQRSGNVLAIQTKYDNNGLFGARGGASVSYRVRVPVNENLDVEEVSGPVDVSGTAGDVRVRDVSGSVRVQVGLLGGSRAADISTVSGTVHVLLAKGSSFSAALHTLSGTIQTFFPGSVKKGFVGQTMDAQVGSAAAKLNVGTISGGITVESESPAPRSQSSAR